MKKITLSLSLLLLVCMLQAQSILHYKYEGSLEEASGAGPALKMLGDEGVFVTDTLDKINSVTKTVYRFGVNSGFQFNNTDADDFLGHSYTIELYMKLDELNSWKRVVDWKNRKSDNGAYVYYGRLNFYDLQVSEEAPVVSGEYTYYVITRDSVSQELLIYSDAEVKISFIDTDGDALLDEDQVLNFFHDDLVVPDEATSGSVAMLKIYSHKLEAAEIAEKFNQIGSQVFNVPSLSKPFHLRVFPNPASDFLLIDLIGMKSAPEANIRLINVHGQQVYNQTVRAPGESVLQLDLPGLANGIYLLVLDMPEERITQKVLINQ